MTILLFICISIAGIFAQDPVVETIYGSVSGKAVPLSDGTIIIDSYLGIPYATPPVGNLRFTVPQNPESWDDTFFATEISTACMQRELLNSIDITHDGFGNFSEDCLHLNIYSPQRENPEELLPVMVYIHGGNYQTGVAFTYPGYFLAQKGVVVVTINYRLGVFGFAYTGDGVIPGNIGLLDQIHALKFVQENIEAFGGDPNQVTIQGQSAGGASVGLLMMSPEATGLFHRAILQSGNEFAPFGMHRPELQPENFIFSVAEKVNCPNDNSVEMVECLREVDAKRLAIAVINCTEGFDCKGGFRPVVDGLVIPDLPQNLRDSGNYNQVPELIGMNEDDGTIFMQFDPNLNMDENGLNRTDYNEYLEGLINVYLEFWLDPSRIQDVFKAFEFYYSDWPYYNDPGRNRDMLGKIFTDASFGYPADSQAKKHTKDNLPVYYYVFDYVSENSSLDEWLGAFHSRELSIVFGMPFFDDNEIAFQHFQGNLLYNTTYTSPDVDYSDFMMTLWTNFAKFGNPTPETVPGPNNTAIDWPLFSDDNLSYLDLKPNPVVGKDYRQQEYAFWTEYLRYLIFGDEFTVTFPFTPDFSEEIVTRTML